MIMKKNTVLLIIFLILPFLQCSHSNNKKGDDNSIVNKTENNNDEGLPEKIIDEQEISNRDNKSAQEKKVLNESVNIPKTTGLLGQDKYRELLKNEPSFGNTSGKGMPVMNNSDRQKYKINGISCISQKKTIYGKQIHKTDSWRMESILGYAPDHMMQEYFVFYDNAGNYINCFEAGSHMFYAGDLTESEIEGNKILCKTEWMEPGSGGGTVYVQYEITPQLTINEIKRWEETYEDEF